MWLMFPIALGLVLILVGSVAFGGAFTVIAVPVVVGAALILFGWRFLGRLLGERQTEAQGGTNVPSTTEASYDSRSESVTPGQLADARRSAQ